MSFFSALKSVAKVATLPITAPIKLQAKLGSRALSMVARAVPAANPFGRSSSAAPSSTAAAPTGWRTPLRASPPPVSYDPSSAPTPAQASWFPSIAAAVQATPASSAPLPYGSTTPYPAPAPYMPGGVPGGTPLSYAQPGYSPPPSYSGGGGYDGGGSYASRGDPSDYDLRPDEYPSDDSTDDDQQLGDIDYAAVLADDDGYGLGDWKSGLLSVVKGAASGALSSTVNALAPKPAAPKPLLSGGMSTGMKVAIGAAVAAPVLFLALRHHSPPPARARNPRRRRRRSRR